MPAESARSLREGIANNFPGVDKLELVDAAIHCADVRIPVPPGLGDHLRSDVCFPDVPTFPFTPNDGAPAVPDDNACHPFVDWSKLLHTAKAF